MSGQQSRRKDIEPVGSVEHLLGLLGKLTRRDPSPALRERLGVLASQRLREGSEYATQVTGKGRKRPVWLKPAFAAFFLAATGLAGVLVVHFRTLEPLPAAKAAKDIPHTISPENKPNVAPAPPIVARQSEVHRRQPARAQVASKGRMTMQLPYSNSAIETGTDTTIRVSMSQSELMSLGFPINATIHDRRIAAELTLGGDGLPRTISLPLPLEVMKEKR
jgi:hypothetical protein